MKVTFIKRDKSKYINSKLTSKNLNFKFIIKEIGEINITSIINKKNQYINPNYKNSKIEN